MEKLLTVKLHWNNTLVLDAKAQIRATYPNATFYR